MDRIATQAQGEGTVVRVEASVRERDTEAPVESAVLWLEPRAGGWTRVDMTSARGLATMHLVAGRYRALVRSPGRPAMDLGNVLASAGAAHRLEATVPKPAGVRLSVTERVRGEERPAPAWVWARRASRDSVHPIGQPLFPETAWGETGVTDAAGRGGLSLSPGPAGTGTPHLLVAWRGPLYRVATSPLRALEGRTVDLKGVLEREVDPGSYVSVDFLQHSEGSLDCALTRQERSALNAAAGLDAAVVSDPLAAPAGLSELPVAVAACRVDVPGLGALSLLEPEPTWTRRQQLANAMAEASSGEDLLQAADRLLPDAPIQVDRPVDEDVGWLSLHEHLPAERFDLLELLHAGDVAGARRVLPEWFALLNAGRRVLATGGSGSVGLAGPLPGLARTFVHCPSADGSPSAEQVRAAVTELPEHGNAFVSNGPFLEVTLQGEPVGSTVRPKEGTVRLHVRVLAARWMDVSWCRVHRDGRVAREFPILPGTTVLRCDRTFDFPAEGDGWFVVEVEGERPMGPPGDPKEAPAPWAVTNPFWVDADGDGAVTPTAGT